VTNRIAYLSGRLWLKMAYGESVSFPKYFDNMISNRYDDAEAVQVYRFSADCTFIRASSAYSLESALGACLRIPRLYYVGTRGAFVDFVGHVDSLGIFAQFGSEVAFEVIGNYDEDEEEDTPYEDWQVFFLGSHDLKINPALTRPEEMVPCPVDFYNVLPVLSVLQDTGVLKVSMETLASFKIETEDAEDSLNFLT
jgi:hypothetical protein